jgi:perosamine synthetase
VLEAGYKDNMTDLAAALGIEQLKKAEAFNTARAHIAAQYDEAFADLPEIALPARDGQSAHAWHLYVIQLDPARLTIDRGGFIDELKARNIGTSVHFIPLHRHPYYQRTLGARPEQFPVADAAFARIVSLPIFPTMQQADVDDVIDAVRQTIVQHRR